MAEGGQGLGQESEENPIVILPVTRFAIRNKCLTSSNRCLTTSNKKLLVLNLLLVVRPGAPSSVLVTTSKALVTRSDALAPSSVALDPGFNFK